MVSLRSIPTLRGGALLAAALSFTSAAAADAVTDWNLHAVEATKGFDGSTGLGVTLDSNAATRVEAIQARAVFDAVNAVEAFNPGHYYYAGRHAGSARAAAVQAAHDVLLAELPDPATDPSADARWGQVRAWLDRALVADLTGVAADDGGIAAGKAAAAAANQARKLDNAVPATTYGAGLVPTFNPGIGLWRQSNAGAAFVDPSNQVPTGFDANGVIQGRPGVGLSFRDVTPFSLSTRQKAELVARVPLSPAVGSAEYELELAYIKRLGERASTARSADQTAQALFYKQDAEIFVFEAARVASAARGYSLHENAELFALLTGALVDARIAAFSSKYEQKYWRPITALNAGPDGKVVNAYAAWRPFAATPSHPSNTSGHSATGAAGAEILRAFFGDKIRPDGKPATLGSLPWLVGTNSGTGVTTSRSVSSFSQLQLENGASRLYLGVHFGYDNLQGQLLGVSVADAIILTGSDPAAYGLRVPNSPASLLRLLPTLLLRPDLYGFYGRSTEPARQRD